MLPTFDAMTNSDLPGVFCPVRSLLDLLPVGAGSPIVLAATVTAAAPALILAAACGRAAPATAAASVPGRVMAREEALGHVRRVRAELKGR